MEYYVDHSHQLIVAHAGSRITFQDLYDYIHATSRDPEARLVTRELLDLGPVERVALSSADIRRIASINTDFSAQFGHVRTAIVAKLDVAYGLARMYEQLAEPHLPHVEVFRTLEEAKAYLDLPAVWYPARILAA